MISVILCKQKLVSYGRSVNGLNACRCTVHEFRASYFAFVIINIPSQIMVVILVWLIETYSLKSFQFVILYMTVNKIL